LRRGGDAVSKAEKWEVSEVSGISGVSANDFGRATVLFRQLESPRTGVRRRAAGEPEEQLPATNSMLA